MRFEYTTAANDQVTGTLDEGESFGYHTGPITFAIGMAPGNVDFDTLFPNASAEQDPDTGNLVLKDKGEPAHPIEAFVPPPPAPFSVAKIDVLRQLSDDDFAKLDAKVKEQSARTQAIYNTAVNFVSDSQEYGLLWSIAVELFGEARAKTLLQPAAAA